MIITQTPLRISFFGGGTDYPEYFTKYGGAVLATAIDKYAYFSITPFYSELFDYSLRISYRQVECVRSIDEIQHSPFRECLRCCGVTNDVEVDFSAELPAFTGLGSSSAFVVGLLNTLYSYQGKFVRPIDLAYQAVEIEREALKEAVGCQDQTIAAIGGFNVIEFHTTKNFIIQQVPLNNSRLRDFEEHLMIFFTGIKRHANELAATQVKKVESNKEVLASLRQMVDKGFSILTNTSCSLSEFGFLLNEAWRSKQSIDDCISNGTINKIYEEGLEAGALGGKLLGAGGGGFILLFVPPERKETVRRRLSHLREIPVKINAPGSRVIYRS